MRFRSAALAALLPALFALRPAGLSAQVAPAAYFSLGYVRPSGDAVRPTGFRQPEGGILVQGELSTRIVAGLEARFRDVGAFSVEQAWAGYRFADALTLKAGLYLVPFGIFNTLNRPHETLLVERPLAAADVHPASWRDLGLLAEGRLGVFSYAAWLGNGLGEGGDPAGTQRFPDDNVRLSGGGRLSVLLGQTVEAGGSYAAGRYDAAAERTLVLEGVHLQWLTAGWTILGEYMRASIGNPAPFATGEAEGFYILLLMNPGRFQPIISFQKSRVEDPYHGDPFTPGEGGPGISRDRRRWSFGGRLILSPNLQLKGEYDRDRTAETGGIAGILRLQLTVSF